MTKRTLDPTTLANLGDLTDRFELCDPSGRKIGYFIPALPASAYAGVDSAIGPNELERREREEQRYSTAEVLEHLRNL